MSGVLEYGMDDKQKRKVRNIVSGIILLVLIVFVLAYCGVFEGKQSDEAQIRDLLERSKEEVSDHDWDDLFSLGDMDEQEKQAWIDVVPQQAEYVVIDSISPREMISVSEGATEYSVDVSVVAHLGKLGFTGPQMDSVAGTVYFFKKGDRWYIDFDKSGSTFPYVPKPKK